MNHLHVLLLILALDASSPPSVVASGGASVAAAAANEDDEYDELSPSYTHRRRLSSNHHARVPTLRTMTGDASHQLRGIQQHQTDHIEDNDSETELRIVEQHNEIGFEGGERGLSRGTAPWDNNGKDKEQFISIIGEKELTGTSAGSFPKMSM